jgi:transcriptional regulator with XRE-family HTH domain
MKTSAAIRVKAVREMLGFTRPAFCSLTGIEFSRVATLEHDRSRMSVEELAMIDTVLPDFTDYLMYGKTLDLSLLENSKDERVRFTAIRLRNGEIPEGYGLEEVIVDGRKDQ